MQVARAEAVTASKEPGLLPYRIWRSKSSLFGTEFNVQLPPPVGILLSSRLWSHPLNSELPSQHFLKILKYWKYFPFSLYLQIVMQMPLDLLFNRNKSLIGISHCETFLRLGFCFLCLVVSNVTVWFLRTPAGLFCSGKVMGTEGRVFPFHWIISVSPQVAFLLDHSESSCCGPLAAAQV